MLTDSTDSNKEKEKRYERMRDRYNDISFGLDKAAADEKLFKKIASTKGYVYSPYRDFEFRGYYKHDGVIEVSMGFKDVTWSIELNVNGDPIKDYSVTSSRGENMAYTNRDDVIDAFDSILKDKE